MEKVARKVKRENRKMKVYIGIDNGVTGSIAIYDGVVSGLITFQKTPTIKQLSYTKKKQNISRLDAVTFDNIISRYEGRDVFCAIERPMVNPKMFKATMSAVRCLEATLTLLERRKIPYEYIDSKQWQSEMLPKGCKGRDQLKSASYDIGLRLFPSFKPIIDKLKDADGLLIMEWARRNNL